MTPLDLQLAASMSSGASGGKTGDINLTGGGQGGLASLFKTTPNLAWVPWAIAGLVGVALAIGLILYLRRK